MLTKRFLVVIVLVALGALIVAACTPSPPEPPAAQAADSTEHDGGHMDTHDPENHMAGAHGVPEEAAAVPNPFEANQESMAAGGELFATSCAVCHGETGQGDGPGAAGLAKPPANLTEAHVQELSDGALFYIISHGRPETPMPAWEDILAEEERWQVVNYLRTFGEDGGMPEIEAEAGDHHGEDEGDHHDEAGDHHGEDEGEHEEAGDHHDEDEAEHDETGDHHDEDEAEHDETGDHHDEDEAEHDETGDHHDEDEADDHDD